MSQIWRKDNASFCLDNYFSSYSLQGVPDRVAFKSGAFQIVVLSLHGGIAPKRSGKETDGKTVLLRAITLAITRRQFEMHQISGIVCRTAFRCILSRAVETRRGVKQHSVNVAEYFSQYNIHTVDTRQLPLGIPNSTC